MPTKRTADIASMIRAAAQRIGMNAPLVADDILSEAFPRTMAEAEGEGASSYLRAGFVTAVKRVLRTGASDPRQHDFEQVAECFRPFVRGLRQDSYYVEAQREYVSIVQLIVQPKLLDDARKHLRRKGDETIEEALRLDQLYEALVDTSPVRMPSKCRASRQSAGARSSAVPDGAASASQ